LFARLLCSSSGKFRWVGERHVTGSGAESTEKESRGEARQPHPVSSLSQAEQEVRKGSSMEIITYFYRLFRQVFFLFSIKVIFLNIKLDLE